MDSLKKNNLLMLCILLVSVSFGQRKLTLKDVIREAKLKSIRSKQIENRFQNAFWRNFSYKRQFLPSLVFDGTVPELSRTITNVIQPDGSEEFVNRNQISNRASLSLNQLVPLTGGSIFMRSGLSNIQLTGSTKSTTYLSQPIELGYSQTLFGFNQYKWDKIIEPMNFSEAELLKVEEVEDLSMEAANKYFDLLSAQLSTENARKNLSINDTIYRIGKGRYGYGKIAENDLLQLELSLLNAEIAYEQEKVNLKLTEQRLATFLGYPTSEKLELSLDFQIPEFEVTYDDALHLANQYRSDVIKRERQVIEAEMSIARAKSENRINLNLSASFGLSQTADDISDVYSKPENQEFVSLGVRAPIIQWGLGKGRVKQAEANAELVRITIEQEKIDFDQDIYSKVAAFNLNRKQLKASKRANEVAEKRFYVSKQRYLIGKIVGTDLQLAQQEKDNALLSYISSIRSFWQSYFDIRKMTHFDFEKREVIR